MSECHLSWFQKISGTFLLAGTCIGGGMLALPLALWNMGLWPSTCVLLGSCLFMIITGLLILEVNLWMQSQDAHIISMASATLGRPGRWIAWIVYLFVCYASLVAYIAGGGSLLASFLTSLGWECSCVTSSILVTMCLGSCLFFGHKSIGRFNTLLFFGMIVAYIGLVVLGLDEVNLDYLSYSNFEAKTALMAIPLLLTSFSYQWVIPSVTSMMKGHERSMRFAIIGGISFAAFLYFLWMLIIFGIIPVEGTKGLRWASENGVEISQSLRFFVKSSLVGGLAGFFAFFALATSFLGMALGLFDFLSDGLKIRKKGWGKITLMNLVLVPSCICALSIPRVFELALDVSGGYGDAILNGLIPPLMVWVGRYYQKRHSVYQLPFGKGLLIVIFMISLFVIGLEISKFFS